MKVDVLGVKIDDVNMAEALPVVEKWIRDQDKSFGRAQDKHYIVTPNPEIIVAAQKDKLLKKILNSADLAIADGSGLRLAGKVKNVVAGTDLMEALCKLSARKGFTVGFLGGGEGIAEKAADCLKKKYPGLKVVFAERGGEIDLEGRSAEDFGRRPHSLAYQRKRPASRIRIPPTDILFVAFGHVKQEKWIANNSEKIPAHVFMGVGGAFDYLSGSVPRAPKWVRKLGFEWLYRLIAQPWRIKRQLALLQYLWLLIKK